MGVLCVSLVIAAPAFAQVPVVAYDGPEIFCHILKHFKFEPIRSIEDLANYKAEETLIVVFGDPKPGAEIGRRLANLDDYAWLLASDHRIYAGRFKDADIELGSPTRPRDFIIGGNAVWQAAAEAYQSNERCPFLTPKQFTVRDHPIFRGIDRGLATNRPSPMSSDNGDLDCLVTFPESCRSRDWIPGHGGYIYGTKGDSVRRAVVVAGHGVFINGMIVQNDNDNGLFAVNTVRWLRDGPHGKRKYALMIHDGKVIESFDLPLTGLPPVPIPPVRVINRLVRELENEGIVHRFLEEVVGWPWVIRFGLIVATLGLFVYGVWRLFPARHSLEAVPLLIGMQAPAASQRSVMQLRQLELLWRDNLWEPAQALARQWFLDNARVDPPLWDEAHAAAPPAAQFRSGWWTRHKLAQQLAVVWQYAVSDPARPVRLREFRRLAEAVQSLNQALFAGQLAFAAGKSAKG